MLLQKKAFMHTHTQKKSFIPLCIYRKQNIWPYPQDISLSQCLVLGGGKMLIFAEADWTARDDKADLCKFCF